MVTARRIVSSALIFFLPAIAHSAVYLKVFNPFTGTFDFVNNISSTSIGELVDVSTAGAISGSCLVFDGTKWSVGSCGGGGGGGTTIWVKKDGAAFDNAVSTLNFVTVGQPFQITSSPSGQINISLTNNLPSGSTSYAAASVQDHWPNGVSTMTVTVPSPFGMQVATFEVVGNGNTTDILMNGNSSDPHIILNDNSGSPGGQIAFQYNGVQGGSFRQDTGSGFIIYASTFNGGTDQLRMTFKNTDNGVQINNFPKGVVQSDSSGNLSSTALSLSTGPVIGPLNPGILVSSFPLTGVTAGSYGTASQVSSFTVGVDGRITNAANVTISITNSNLQSGTYSNITGLGNQSQALNMNSHLINNVTDPASSQDAATKNYVDASINGLDWKQAAMFATNAALPANVYANGSSGVGATLTGVSFGALTVDGYTVSVGQRILVKNEVTAANNGIYVVTTVGAVATLYVLTRAADYNQTSEIQAGDAVFIDSGTVNNDSSWIMTTNGTITVGTTAINWTQFAASYSAGGGLTLTGTTFSIDPSSGTLQGNNFNGANQLIKTNSSGINTVQTSSLTAVVTPGTYGSATISPTITFNAQGQIIAASSNTISTGGGAASGVSVATGTNLGFSTWTVNPATTINFSSNSFRVTLKGGSTAYVESIQYFDVNVSSHDPQTWSGIVSSITCNATFTDGQIGYITNGGRVALADNSAAATAPGLVLAVNGGCANTYYGLFLLQGYYAGTDSGQYNLSPGQAVYLGTSGNITTTPPTATDSVTQVLGYMAPRVVAVSGSFSDVFYFKPSVDFLTYQ